MLTPQEIYDDTRTFLVDQVKGNFLIRGNMPLCEDGTIAYNEINAKLKTLLPEGFDLSFCNFIDVSLIDNQGELPSLECEFTSYGAGTPPTAWPPYPDGILLEFDTANPYVIYIHCMNGHDRAGSLTACYQMQYLGVSMADAMAEGVKIMGHDWHTPYKHLIEWYNSTL